MRVLLLGTGRQGKAALHDLCRCREVTEVIAADLKIDASLARPAGDGFCRVRCESVDAADSLDLDRLMRQGIGVVVDLLPVSLHQPVLVSAMRHRAHVVNASYATPELEELAAAAAARGISILPEMGMDPGIDLVLLGDAVRRLDQVDELVSYGAGFPESKAADNPLKYKVTWRFEGVLDSYLRQARVIRQGKTLEIPATEVFHRDNIHRVAIKGVGDLEAYPNGDALRFAGRLGLDEGRLQRMERCVLRWPGHAALWKTLVDIHLLDSEPVLVDGVAVNRRRYLAALLEPSMRYGRQERDVVVVRVEARGTREGRKSRIVHQMIDRRDLTTGLTAMSRTVGFTAAAGAVMIGTGRISRRGLLRPERDVPFADLKQHLERSGIRFHEEMEPSGQVEGEFEW